MSPEYFAEFMDLCKRKKIGFPTEEEAKESAEKLLDLMRALLEVGQNEYPETLHNLLP
jgi:hypothetical protein